MLNLDTHILIFALTDELRPAERRLLSAQTWSISAIALWEIAKLEQLGRIEVSLRDAEVARTLSRIHTWPITIDVCRHISDLDVDVDPADEIIAATSIAHGVPLATRDKRLRRSKLIPIAK